MTQDPKNLRRLEANRDALEAVKIRLQALRVRADLAARRDQRSVLDDAREQLDRDVEPDAKRALNSAENCLSRNRNQPNHRRRDGLERGR